MFDVGWAYSPAPDIRLGFFAGYHYWHEKVTAYGVVCNHRPRSSAVRSAARCRSASTPPVLSYEPTWHAVRIGVEGKVCDRRPLVGQRRDRRRSLCVRCRTRTAICCGRSLADLGPAPNIITKSTYAYGVETELFVNYAVTPNIEIGAGVRYWGLASRNGDVRFGPDFDTSDPARPISTSSATASWCTPRAGSDRSGRLHGAHCGNAAPAR